MAKQPGDAIREMLTERGWTQLDLARVLGRPPSTVNEIVQGKQLISPEIAHALGAAFGNGPEFWMGLEAGRQLSEAQVATDPVRRRAALFDVAPVKEMEKRGWIRRTKTADELEAELRRFFRHDDLSRIPEFPVSTRRYSASEMDELTPLQRAWCFKARAMASDQIVPPFDSSRLGECAKELGKLTAFAPEARKVSAVLANCGIRFVIVEPLPAAKIDGAAFWIDDKPVIALSIRHDRIDSFWFTLFHEFAHIENEDGLSVDSQLVGDDAAPSAVKPAIERRADEQAAERLIPREKIQSFINRVAPLYSKTRIIQFAHRVKVHPGIIVGQLQHRGQIGFHANRELLVKVRDIAISTADVDGWGHTQA